MTKRISVTHFFDGIVLQYPKVVILCILAAAVFLCFQARNFRLDASSETLVMENDEDLRYWRKISSRYSQDEFLILTFTPKEDMFSERTRAVLGDLRDELEALENVSNVLTILDVPLLESPPLSLKELTGELPTLSSARTDIEMAREELRTSPIYSNLVLCQDSQTTALLISLEKDEVFTQLFNRRNELKNKKADGLLSAAEGEELKGVAEELRLHRDKMRKERHDGVLAVRGIADKYRGEAEMFLGGVSMITDDMITFIKSDLKVFGLGLLLFLIIALGLIFGRKRWVIFPMLCCVVSGICMIGLLGLFGWEVTVISSNFISLQLIMTLAITIHLIVRFREMLAERPEASDRELILDTVRLKLKPCVYAVLTTIAGFASLVLSDILPVRTFGWMMMGGLIISLAVTFLLFPAMLVLLKREKQGKKRRLHFPLTEDLAKLTQKCGAGILIVSGIVLVLSGIGISKLRVENSFIDYFRKDTEIYQGMTVIDQCLGGTTPLDVIIDFETSEIESSEEIAEADSDFDEFDEFDDEASADKYWFTSEKVERIKKAHFYLEGIQQTGKVLSLCSVITIAEKLKGGKPLDSLDLALLYSETPDEFKRLLTSPYVSVEDNQARFWVRVRDSDKTLRRNEMLKNIEAELPGLLGMKSENIHLTGMMVLYNNMLQSLFRSQILTLGVTVLILIGMFLVLFRSLKISLIAIFPNLLPIAVVLGVMGWFDIPLDMMTMTIAAIGVGIAVDDTIHYIHRFKREFERCGKYMETMHRCHGTIGHAMYYTSATIIIGFSILAMSNFVPTINFGLLTALAMLIALIAALTLLPQLLIVFKPFGKES
jgi:hypothetical protein